MCGIIGYVGQEQASKILTRGLKRLEYRGYDSCGIAVLKNPDIHVLKGIGSVGKVCEEKRFENVEGNIGISHTRWATHGGVTDENTHPHTSCSGDIAIVHNGIIENFVELKKELKNHVFKSETDSEVIAHLIEEFYDGDFVQAVFKTALKLKGSFAFIAMHVKEKMLVACRKESPLVTGIGENEFFIASDTLSFSNKTRNVVFMSDGEAVVVKNGGAVFYDFFSGKEIKKNVSKVADGSYDVSKGGMDHFLIKEIHEQPDTLKLSLMQDKSKLIEVARMINSAPRVCIIACGTSRHAAIVGRYIISEVTGKYCEVYMASEFQYFVDKIGKDTLIIAVSQSGETADVLGPVRIAKHAGCKLISIVNVVGSSLDLLSDISVYLNAGPEISVASTKAFSSQLMIFYQIAYTMTYNLDEKLVELRGLVDKIREVIANNEEKTKLLAKKIKDENDIYYIARAINFAVASEGALKIKEISYIHAEGMPAGELKHGTLALITDGTPVIAIAPYDYTYSETINNIHEVKARGGFVIGITDHSNGVFDFELLIPKVDPLYYPILANIPCQLLAYYTAVEKGCNVDKPRNLAKSVTVK
ncbi:MAG: glutamine--fructose-6-phosphate transaminase (isomerizing) [Nanoarchaeota archaeon]|nr:glutamine--fructose-6-phosphate transaminase (isomerizing) [Nanoarchaeota archaeon]